MHAETIPAGYCQCGCGRKALIADQSRTDRGEVKGQPRRFLKGHKARADAGTLVQRIEARISFDDDGCWRWTGEQTRYAYGRLVIDRKPKSAHRVVYELLVDALAEDIQLHHRCRNTLCVNPAHLEPLTAAQHCDRHASEATHCRHGHRLDEANTYLYSRPGDGKTSRRCRRCRRLAVERYRDAGRAAR